MRNPSLLLPFNQHRNPGFADNNRICRRTQLEGC